MRQRGRGMGWGICIGSVLQFAGENTGDSITLKSLKSIIIH